MHPAWLPTMRADAVRRPLQKWCLFCLRAAVTSRSWLPVHRLSQFSMDNKVLLRSTPCGAYLLTAALHGAVSCTQAINRLAGSRHQSQSTCSRDANAPLSMRTATSSRHAVNHGTSFTSGSRSASRFQPGASLWLSAFLQAPQLDPLHLWLDSVFPWLRTRSSC